MNKEETTKYIPEESESKINVDFDALIAECDRLRSVPKMSPKEIHYVLKQYEKINSESVDTAFEADKKLLSLVVDRIAKECGETGSLSIEEIFAESPLTSAVFFPTMGAIGFRGADAMRLHNPGYLIYSLASFGSVTQLQSLHHEFIHSKQSFLPEEEALIALKNDLNESCWHIAYYVSRALLGLGQTKAQRGIGRLKEKIAAKEELAETHAYIGTARRDNLQLSFSDFLRDMQTGYSFGGEPKEIDRLILANFEVKRLYALGLSDEEIGLLVRDAKWDYKKRRYDILDEKAAQIMKEKDLDEEDVDNLVLADDLRRQIFINKTQLIAQDELKKAVKNLQK